MKEKIVYAFGDSIIYGHTAPEYSFLQLLAEDYPVKIKMFAVNGASVLQVDSQDKEDPLEKKNNNYIINQIRKAKEEAPDIIILDGYINDAYGDPKEDLFNCKKLHPDIMKCLGMIRGRYTTKFDTDTFCGSFEEIIFTLQHKWPLIPILFLIPHKSGARSWKCQTILHDLTVNICEEWGVEVVDIFKDAELDTRDTIQMKEYIMNGEGSHPNVKACRKYYIPIMISKLNMLLRNPN